ncbi:tyrosine-protein phosphatase [Tsukamurella paurometabola]|uniref:Tyrosine-protein phosphatase n=1 Tax=Tsukamurella paurometabola TaxID=2061 RepID=A0A3P8MDM9_TSUPA|nr:tyrosine-protein phosphatase [Tsukamurella paurometabola]MBS4103451.1 tyrosine-protein phosphatase [Tsukamurella paurometabola]UEA83439.1 tyrosine-protein phosphatase [Tsukamurella paurometabola]VDR40556.1 Tyrosine-protein phosphatase precursor [Tsukamurella paurometabola]
MHNFRDVAGVDGYAADGGRMRRGLLFRSSALDADAIDPARLAEARLADVFDLRMTAEVTPKPDVVPDGARYVRLNVIGDDVELGALDPKSLKDAAGARGLLTDVYRMFVSEDNARAQFATLVRAVAGEDRPQVFHCTAGKDRTGWAAAIVQRIVGVSPDDVMADYLLTNDYSAAVIDKIAAGAAAERGEAIGEAARVLAGVFPEALTAAFDEADARYGDFAGYVRAGLGLDDAVIERLHAKLVG